jgi:hypothetical protein
MCYRSGRPVDYTIDDFTLADTLCFGVSLDNFHRQHGGTMSDSALDRQVGGNHYMDYKIQPYEFFLANKIPHHKVAIIRRILRYDHPTGKGKVDLDKIQHEVELIKELDPIFKDRTNAE